MLGNGPYFESRETEKSRKYHFYLQLPCFESPLSRNNKRNNVFISVVNLKVSNNIVHSQNWLSNLSNIQMVSLTPSYPSPLIIALEANNVVRGRSLADLIPCGFSKGKYRVFKIFLTWKRKFKPFAFRNSSFKAF